MPRLTVQQIEKRVYNLHPEAKCMFKEYIPGVKIKIKCENEHVFYTTPSSVANGIWCAQCSYDRKKVKMQKVIERVNSVKTGYTLLTENVNKTLSEKLKFICKNGHVCHIRLDHYENGAQCKTCTGKTNKKLTIKEIKLFLKEFKPHGKLLSTEYKNKEKKLLWECKNGHTWEATLRNVKGNKTWCPYCPLKSEQECRDIIEDLTKHKFLKVRPKWLNRLELDGYNKKLNIAFEYQGAQHYKLKPGFFHKKNGVHDFIHQHCRDKIKKYLCEKNKTTLIIVPYYEKNKEQFIKKELEKAGFIF